MPVNTRKSKKRNSAVKNYGGNSSFADSFVDGFPFGAELRRIFEAEDLLRTNSSEDEDDEGGINGSGINEKPLLLTLREAELHECLAETISLGSRKRIWRRLQRENVKWNERHHQRRISVSATTANGSNNFLDSSGESSSESDEMMTTDHSANGSDNKPSSVNGGIPQQQQQQSGNECLQCHNPLNVRNRRSSKLEAERWKTLLAFLYALVVSWLSSFVMVIVHDRVPDMEKYPPLPDILLDNLPHIPWAFEMCELTGMALMTIWTTVCVFHKHRFILMRRFFSISGTIFLLRCVTMLITSLSVPGKHLDCAPRPYGDIRNKLYNAYLIWSGLGMSVQGVRTCGDYMFSGHTVSLTLLNFFITEYTSRRIYFLHTVTWIFNVFGVFFILAAHEHYSIDVFVAFYISSRLFLYYHTLANNKSNWSVNVGQKAWFYFPLFYFFESKIDGKVPNEFEMPLTLKDIRQAKNKVLAACNNLYYGDKKSSDKRKSK